MPRLAHAFVRHSQFGRHLVTALLKENDSLSFKEFTCRYYDLSAFFYAPVKVVGCSFLGPLTYSEGDYFTAKCSELHCHSVFVSCYNTF